MATFLLYFLAFLALQVFARHFLNKIQNIPPSPFPCLPMIGHLYLLKQPLFRTLAKISDRHGSVVFLQLGNRSAIIVSSPSAAEECLSKNDIIFASRLRLMIGEHMGDNYRSFVWSPYGENWRNLRRIASIEILSNSRSQMPSSIRIDEVSLLMRKLLGIQEKPVDLRTVFFELTVNVIMRMVARKRYYGENVADVEEATRFRKHQVEVKKVIFVTNRGDFLPWLKSKKLEQRIIECQQNRVDFFWELID